MKLIKLETLYIIDDFKDYKSILKELREMTQEFSEKHDLYIIEGNIEVRARNDNKLNEEKFC